MSETLREQVEATINGYEDPVFDASLQAARELADLQIDGSRVQAHLRCGFPTGRHGPELVAGIKAAVEALEGVDRADITVESVIAAGTGQEGVQRLKNVKNIIAVSSAKGGVGKSTVAANLALALAGEGASVGMLDADIYGPSQPRMLGIKGKPESADGKTFEPMVSHGVQSMSVGYLIDEEQPMVWRGPMVTQALQQLLNDTNWQDLDYLIVDMPPGTGDIQLTLSQRVPVSGAVIVTTPQDIATLDARKGLQMFNKVNVPVLGIVENMSIHVCSSCGHEEHLFGEGGGRRVADDYGVPLLGSLPLEIAIREHADSGTPSVVAEPDGAAARRFREVALRMTAALAVEASGANFPAIVFEDD